VIWETAHWRLSITGEATASGSVRLRYRLVNLTGDELRARLFVVLRPFQVTPPWQSFRNVGGVSRIHDLSWQDGGVSVNQTARITPLSESSGFGALTFDEGSVARHLATGALPGASAVRDPFGFACGALAFEAMLPALGSSDYRVASDVLGVVPVSDEPSFDWGARLSASLWSGAGWADDAVRAALTAAAQILVTRSGPALQPGPRRYTRSWIRDGAMMGAALLRVGRAEEVREFIRWYAPQQRADGFVPCCIDSDGVDWLVEHDSHGQLIALIADYHAFTADRAFVQECWNSVEKAAAFIDASLEADGLMPISVSHEGYLAQPVHSYWDDFWTLRGLRDAVQLAHLLGRDEQATRWEALAARLDTALFASIEATRTRRHLDFIPGSVEWADFDPTATANAIYLFDVPDAMNRAALDRTFDIYLTEWRGKRSGAVDWTNYTPYEIRIIGALVRMGRRAAALELLKFFLSDRRPPAWNQWPEIAWRNEQAPAHVGDLPHTWIAGEYVLALRSLFAYERESDRSLVVGAGLASEWLEGDGVQVDRMPTLYGKLSYRLRRTDAQTLRFEIGAGVTAALVLRPPGDEPLTRVLVNGAPYTNFDAHSVTVHETPAQVVCTVSQ
jgi:Amylo-alpha-1,6-glucosidase